ncbi:hypothetical protein [Mesorhizobium sp.]|uniref:hypothetical protein n=1 Tax=Mesorhizobium sp. TaxID=1871066 RepID=UPI003BAB3D6B
MTLVKRFAAFRTDIFSSFFVTRRPFIAEPGYELVYHRCRRERKASLMVVGADDHPVVDFIFRCQSGMKMSVCAFPDTIVDLQMVPEWGFNAEKMLRIGAQAGVLTLVGLLDDANGSCLPPPWAPFTSSGFMSSDLQMDKSTA